MPYHGPVARWELYWANLDPSVGSEQGGKRRPVLIVSNSGFNAAFEVVAVLSLTKLAGKRRRVYPFEVELPAEVIGTGLTSIVMPQQIRTISKQRLLSRIGALTNPDKRTEIENRLLEHLGIEFEAEIPG
ncbi:MAG: type II toxin-antitoxin system PemK/MazF family toxin [Gemmatimonadetes bacterium]|nr:type II toxin-antitoxin system PemK/MazF family toxin [Gemmatimonadota bacterium]